MQCFYMMVGLPGSGKSWYAENKLPDAVIHSSDTIREELLSDISDQNHQELVFQTLHDRVLSDLRAGKDVVYDAEWDFCIVSPLLIPRSRKCAFSWRRRISSV